MSDNFKKTIANRISFLLTENRVSALQLAKATGINIRTLDRYTSQQCSISAENLAKIAEFFNVSMDYLAGRNAERKDAEYKIISKILTNLKDEMRREI